MIAPTVCIHCRRNARSHGLYCDDCLGDAYLRVERARRREVPVERVQGVQRQRFDAGTCPCHWPFMRFLGGARNDQRGQ